MVKLSEERLRNFVFT